VLDMAGLAQKNGAVMSFVRIAERPEQLHAARIATGGADAVVGCDVVTTASADGLAKMHPGRTRVVANCAETPTADFTHKPDWEWPEARMRAAISQAAGEGNVDFLDATDLATRLLGDAIATNMFMLGYAWQKGFVPISLAALSRAIELNEVAIEANKRAFAWGRYCAHDQAAVERIAAPAEVIPIGERLSRTLDEIVERRAKLLTAYQNAAYAARYRALVEHVRDVEQSKLGGTELAEAVARYYAKLLAYKDEYEVARLYADGSFEKKLGSIFECNFRLTFHLAPPLLSKRDPVSGEAKKMKFGPWMMSAFRILAGLKWMRGTPLDLFGRSEERRTERALIEEYEHAVNVLLDHLSRDNHALAIEIASLPEHIRGFGHIKAKNIALAREKRRELLARYREPGAGARAAA